MERAFATSFISIALVLVVLVTSSSRTVEMAQAPVSSERSNVVLILADDLGYGDLGVYGHPTIRTPYLDRLAGQGARLTSYYSVAPACTPARAALMTGRYAVRMGLGAVIMPESTHGIPAPEITLPEALGTRGYQTMMVGKWHLGHATPDMLPTAHGFDGWFGLPYSNDMIPPWVETTRPLRFYRDAEALDEKVEQSALTHRYTEQAVSFIQEAEEPFFLYVSHSMPHLPIDVPDSLEGRSRAGLYGDVIETLDSSTGQILDALDARQLADRTLVVFVSDNGPWSNAPERMLQGGVERWHAGSTGPLRGAKGTTWEGGVRVPAIVRWPGRIRPGLVSAEPADAMDLYATVVEAAGATLPPDHAIDGRDLSPLLLQGQPLTARSFYFFNGETLEAVREGPWKLRIEGDDAPELYQLEEDPHEQFDRAAEEPATVERLTRSLRTFAASIDAER